MAKQRQVRVEQKSALAAMAQLELRSDEELAAETKHRAAAQAILGARASERYDAARAREHFRKAIAAARPQERMQLRRMAEASLALAERRPDDLKAAVEKLGQQAPSSRQLFVLRLMGLISPAPGATLVQKAARRRDPARDRPHAAGARLRPRQAHPAAVRRRRVRSATSGLGILVVLVALVVLALRRQAPPGGRQAKAKAKNQPQTKARSARPGG